MDIKVIGNEFKEKLNKEHFIVNSRLQKRLYKLCHEDVIDG